MKAEAQRIAIAEACGYFHAMRGVDVWYEREGGHVVFNDLPDYLNDLNAMHEAIRSRAIDEQWVIFATLAEIVDAELPAYMGTPAQYAEAFLRTIGKWETSE